MNPYLERSLIYAELGWPVFPCRPGEKVPLIATAHPEGDPARGTCRGECGRFGHGCYDATVDVDVIRQWWQSSPSANVAIATGAPGPDVVDIDRKGAVDGMVAMERLKRTGLLVGPIALVCTPSGGWHLYFPGSEQGNSVRSRHGVDFRARGGYVVAPPSIVDGKPYQLLERRGSGGRPVDWSRILRFLEPPRQRPVRPSYATGSLDRLAAWVADQPQGNRNDGLYWAAARAIEKGHTDTEALEPLVTAAIVAGLPETEARRTISSAVGRFVGG